MKTADEMFRDLGYEVEESEDFIMLSKGDTVIDISKGPPITIGKLVRKADILPYSIDFIVQFSRGEILSFAQLIKELEAGK